MARTRKSNLAAGVILVVVGGVLLVTRFALMNTAPAWLLGLGVGLALIAIVSSSYHALVGGMVLLGLGAGMVLGDHGLAGMSSGAWIQLGLGAGFIGIWVLALILRLNRHWWPLVPGSILLVLGGARYLRNVAVIPPQAMIAVRTWWPAALVVVGVWVLVRALRT
jgi:LiaI-LiaF-like transmembrane region